jgi:microcystin-dependent protein
MKKLLPSIALIAALILPGLAHAHDEHSNHAYLGQIFIFAGSFCPKNSHEANGQLLEIRYHEALFSLLGNEYGGDGKTAFALPKITLTTGDEKDDVEGKKSKVKLKTCIATGGDFPERDYDNKNNDTGTLVKTKARGAL